jgi:hypothetical protein
MLGGFLRAGGPRAQRLQERELEGCGEYDYPGAELWKFVH